MFAFCSSARGMMLEVPPLGVTSLVVAQAPLIVGTCVYIKFLDEPGYVARVVTGAINHLFFTAMAQTTNIMYMTLKSSRTCMPAETVEACPWQ